MDAFTLMLAGALAGAIMASGMGLQYVAGVRKSSLLDWSLAGLFFACHGLLGAFAQPAGADAILVPAIGGACFVAGHAGILAGLRRQLDQAAHWKALALVTCLVLAAYVLPGVHGSATGAMMVPLGASAVLDLAAARVVWRHARPESRIACLPLALLALASALQACAAAGLLAGGRAPGAVQAGSALFTLVFVCLAMTGCALFIAHQQELALHSAGMIDPMTGWPNRRALNDIAWRTFRHCQRLRQGAFFVTFDIDHFKAVNDRYGLSVGDAAIRHVAEVAAAVARGAGNMFRIGDEEFAMLLTGTAPDDACRIAEHLREVVALSPLDVDGETLPLTISVGVAGIEAGDIQWEDILRRADQALRYAKQLGRNRVSGIGLSCCNHCAPELSQPA